MSEGNPTLQSLLARVRDRQQLAGDAEPREFVADPVLAVPLYENQRLRLGIDFRVARLAFPGLETMDPRVLRIAPGATNERHRHAHESLFVVLAGRGSICIGESWVPVQQGQVAFVPRWAFHQTRNGSPEEDLVILAITDFGLTRSVLGDYDHRTRMGSEDGHGGG